MNVIHGLAHGLVTAGHDLDKVLPVVTTFAQGLGATPAQVQRVQEYVRLAHEVEGIVNELRGGGKPQG